MAFNSVDEILDFAIANEEKAASFYTDLASRMEHEHMREALLAFAEEERGHKAKLLAIKEGKRMLAEEARVLDLKIGDRLDDIKLSTGLDYQQALVLAMKAEKAAFRLYQTLATATPDASLKRTLLNLAQEEARHKLRFEIEYDDRFYQEM